MTNENIENKIVCDVHETLREISTHEGWDTIYLILSQLAKTMPEIVMPEKYKTEKVNDVLVTSSILAGVAMFEGRIPLNTDPLNLMSLIDNIYKVYDDLAYDKLVDMVDRTPEYKIEISDEDALALLKTVDYAAWNTFSNYHCIDSKELRIANFVFVWYKNMKRYKVMIEKEIEINNKTIVDVASEDNVDKFDSFDFDTSDINVDSIEPLVILARVITTAERIMEDYMESILGRSQKEA